MRRENVYVGRDYKDGHFIKICYIDISTIINLTTKVIYNCLLEPDKKL